MAAVALTSSSSAAAATAPFDERRFAAICLRSGVGSRGMLFAGPGAAARGTAWRIVGSLPKAPVTSSSSSSS